MKQPDRHGGNIHAARRLASGTGRDILDFSASINPSGPSSKVVAALKRMVREIPHYPDPDVEDCCQAFARHHALRRSQVLAGNGSNELITCLPQALGIRRAFIVGPTYSEYAQSIIRLGGQVRYVHARETEQYRPPLEQVLHCLQKAANSTKRRGKQDAIFLCNPNSPTGQLLSRQQVTSVIYAARKLNAYVIVDEAFMDYCEEHSMIPLFARFANVVILRSFTKFYALPGLRLGMLVGATRLLDRVRSCLPTWSVNVFAQEAGRMALQDKRFVSNSLSMIHQERRYMTDQLRALHGCQVYPTVANFLMVKLPRGQFANVVTRKLALNGILIRDLSRVPGLSARMIRIGIRTRKDNRRLLQHFGRIFGVSC